VHVRLVLEDHQGHDVAAFVQVLRFVEELAQFRQIAEVVGFLRRARERLRADEVSPMRLIAVLTRSRTIPPSDPRAACIA
jgi:hypothetical protein